MRRMLLLSVAILLAIFGTWTIVRRCIPSHIEYRGEKIKLTKYYLTYEDYKDDSHNIDPTEIVRVQRLVLDAPMASSFSSRKDMVDAAFSIHFPGYGVGGLSDGTNDAENSLRTKIATLSFAMLTESTPLSIRSSGLIYRTSCALSRKETIWFTAPMMVRLSLIGPHHRQIEQATKGKIQIDFSTWLLFMPARTYSPTHFRVQYNRPSGA